MFTVHSFDRYIDLDDEFVCYLVRAREELEAQRPVIRLMSRDAAMVQHYIENVKTPPSAS